MSKQKDLVYPTLQDLKPLYLGDNQEILQRCSSMTVIKRPSRTMIFQIFVAPSKQLPANKKEK